MEGMRRESESGEDEERGRRSVSGGDEERE